MATPVTIFQSASVAVVAVPTWLRVPETIFATKPAGAAMAEPVAKAVARAPAVDAMPRLASKRRSF